MKHPLLLSLLVLASSALANDLIPVLKTTNAAGTLLELRDVRVMKVEPDGLRVMHSSGTAKVPYERLPDELLAKYGIDSSKAREHRAEVQARTAAAPAAAQSSGASPSAPAAARQSSAGKLVTKEDIKAAWLRDCEQCFICPSDPQGASKRQANAQRAALIRSGAWDSTAETYARQANARNAGTAAQ
jgi:hypothetical protein